MSKVRILLVAIAVYAALGIVTFGRAKHHIEKGSWGNDELSLASAIFWPLYWSWELQKP
jgi:hypothetical protein